MNNHIHSAPQSKQEENGEERKNHVCSVIETRQSKATTPKDNSFFLKRKRRAVSGGIMYMYMYVHDEKT